MITQEELKEILEQHKLWLEDAGGKRADLHGSNLRHSNLRHSNLRHSNLRHSDLRHSDLCGSNLRGSNLSHSDLRGSNLRGSDLRGSDLDYSAWPLWCGSLKAHVDDRIAIQLLYHTLSVVQHSPYVSDELKHTLLTQDVVNIANRFHRVGECGKLSVYEETTESDRNV